MDITNSQSGEDGQGRAASPEGYWRSWKVMETPLVATPGSELSQVLAFRNPADPADRVSKLGEQGRSPGTGGGDAVA